MVILQEEVGEAAHELLQGHNYRREVTHIAAVAVAMLEQAILDEQLGVF